MAFTGTHPGISGREPLSVLAARTLAPWPPTIAIWGLFGGFSTNPDGGHRWTLLAVTGFVLFSMVWAVAAGAGRSLSAPRVIAWLGASIVATITADFFSVLIHLDPLSQPTGWLALTSWLVGAAAYEGGRRLLGIEGVSMANRSQLGVDVVSHIVISATSALGVMTLVGPGGLPLPFVVGPLLAVRCGLGADLRVPHPKSASLQNGLMVASAVSAVGVALSAIGSCPSHAPAPLGMTLSLLLAGYLALVGAVSLFRQGLRARSSIWGTVVEHRPEGLVLAVRGEPTTLVHVVPSHPVTGGGIPRVESTIALIDVRELPLGGSPYRESVGLLQARLVWRGTAREMSRSLFMRSWTWFTWAAVTLAIAGWIRFG